MPESSNPAQHPTPRATGVRATPHAASLNQHFATARSAVFALLDAGCLLRSISVFDSGAIVRLHRAPQPALAGAPRRVPEGNAPTWKCVLDDWRGVRVEWPDETPARAPEPAVL